jgi:hypothetical protein
MSWSRLIRFLDDEDQVCLGDAAANSAQDFTSLLESGNLTAEQLAGTDIFNAKPTGEIVHVKSLLGPLIPQDVPIIRCVGLNYAKHSMPSLSFLLSTLALYTDNSSQRNREGSTPISLHLYKAIPLSHRLE